MNASGWAKVSALYHELVDLETDVRQERMEVLAREDAELYEELKKLLAAEDDLHPVLQTDATHPWQLGDDTALVGVDIGPYHLLEHLGSGGMGSVFRAERLGDDFDREVALKLVRPGALSEEAKQGFRQERQILASLTHPGIARLYDGGTNEDGRLYFSMELVEGVDLMKYVSAREAGLAERLSLFLEVARAIAYAHARLVLHLDLKPANILVSAEAGLKVLDFGVAERLQEGEQSRQAVEGQSQYRYTLAYAAPEQLRGEAVSTRTDIYSLGVLLYQLLCAKLPVPYERETPLAYRAKVLRTQISPPSKIFGVPGIASAQLVGDLDMIVMHCLSADPEDRYASVDQLIADLEAYQQARPISLRQQDNWYVLKRFARRQRAVLLSLAAGFVALLLLGTYYTLQVQAQRDQALREAQKNETLLNLMTGIFLEADPIYAQGDTLTIYDLLAQTERRLDTTLESQPELWMPINNTLASIYLGINEYEQAEKLIKRSIALIEADSLAVPLTLQRQSWFILGDWQFGQGLYAEASASTLKALNLALRTGDRKAPLYDYYVRLGDIEAEQRQVAVVDSFYRLALEAVLADKEPRQADLAHVTHVLGSLNRDIGNYELAENYLRRSLKVKQRLYDPPHSEIAYTLNHLASLYYDQAIYDSALYYAKAGLEQRREVFGSKHIETVASMLNLSRTLDEMGELDASLQIKYEAAAVIEALFPDPHPYRIAPYSQLGSHLLENGAPEKAEAQYLQGVAMYQELREAYPDNDYHFQGSMMYHGLAQARRTMGQYEAGLIPAQKALELFAQLNQPESYLHAMKEFTLGDILHHLGRQEEAESLLRHAQSVLQALPEKYHAQLEVIEADLAD